MNWKRILLGVVIVVVVAAGIYLAYTQFFAPESDTEESAEAESGETSEIAVDTSLGFISAEGSIVPLRDALLSFQTGGEIIEVIAEKGSVVERGDPILRLDATDQEIALVQAEAAVEIEPRDQVHGPAVAETETGEAEK